MGAKLFGKVDREEDWLSDVELYEVQALRCPSRLGRDRGSATNEVSLQFGVEIMLPVVFFSTPIW